MKKNAKRTESVKSVEVKAVTAAGDTHSTGEDPGQMGSGG